jgi:hypothetical protein
MKSITKKFYMLAIVAVVGVVVATAILLHMSKVRNLERLEQEYMTLLDEKMSNVYEDDKCIKYQLTNVSYSVEDITKQSGEYCVSVVIDCSSSYSWDSLTASTEKKLLAYAVEDYVPGSIAGMTRASTGEIFTLYNDNYSGIMVTAYINGSLVLEPEPKNVSSSSSKSNDTLKCKSCGRSFKKGSDNAKSIRKTNMCTSCYKSYKSASDYLKEQPVN